MSLARRALPAHGRLDLRRSTRRRLCGGNDGGWIFGHLLDGAGGSQPLAPWDDGAVRRAREGDGSWVHLDLRAPKAQDFIASCARAKGRDDEICRRTHVSSLMVADPRKTQPRCEVSSACAGMMLTLRANFGKRFEAHAVESKNVVPFRMWLGRGIHEVVIGHSLFASLPEGLVSKFVTLVRLTRAVDGDRIIVQGEESHSMFIILSGEATVIIDDDEAMTRCMAPLVEGDSFGELAALGIDVVSDCTVSAVGDVELYVLN